MVSIDCKESFVSRLRISLARAISMEFLPRIQGIRERENLDSATKSTSYQKHNVTKPRSYELFGLRSKCCDLSKLLEAIATRYL